MRAQSELKSDLSTNSDGQQCGGLKNSEFLSTVDHQLSYLPAHQKQDVSNLLHTCCSVLSDTQSSTTVLEQDTDLGKLPLLSSMLTTAC